MPDDVVELIVRHWAAMVLQRRWLRHSHYGHARRHETWSRVRQEALPLADWRILVRYPLVRREWRREPASWLNADALVRHAIRCEAQAGMWGPLTRRLVPAHS